MLKKYEYIILDLDGTLIEETGALTAQAASVSSVFGSSQDEVQKIIFAFFAANDRAVREGGEHKNDIPQYMIWMGETLGVDVSKDEAAELATAWTAAYQNTSKDPVLFDDTIEFLEGLKEQGYTPILASGGGEEEKCARLDAAGIESHFRKVFAAKEVGFQKQDVRFWQAVLAELNVPADSIIVVGNQLNDDIQFSQLTGMHTVLINRPNTFKKVRDPEGIIPDHTVVSLTEILDLI